MFDKTILVVDDDEMILMMLGKILSKQFNVITAVSGEAALEKYGANRPDLILSDYMMPGMNGLQMMDKLRAIYGSDVYAVFMTANEQEETEFEVFRHGALHFIKKPIKADVLIDAIKFSLEKIDDMKRND
ncbi:response regulator [Butyrivibrio sp. VCD2006]|uniref:response regulator n=1 Tax=Butyrivibrio sp. VCD2006 TaxID=1280664 RepID=UPI0003F6AB67|nr:response regulator [Butyrivibrio sp. VCD2006]